MDALEKKTEPNEVPCTPGEKAQGFPAVPGVYLMKDALGRVIYVGKAKNLRNRAGHVGAVPAECHARRLTAPGFSPVYCAELR